MLGATVLCRAVSELGGPVRIERERDMKKASADTPRDLQDRINEEAQHLWKDSPRCFAAMQDNLWTAGVCDTKGDPHLFVGGFPSESAALDVLFAAVVRARELHDEAAAQPVVLKTKEQAWCVDAATALRALFALLAENLACSADDVEVWRDLCHRAPNLTLCADVDAVIRCLSATVPTHKVLFYALALREAIHAYLGEKAIG